MSKEIIECIESKKPFSIIRLGFGPETYFTYEYICFHKINQQYLHPTFKTLYNAGIYGNLEMMQLFCEHYNEAIFSCDVLACFNNNIMNTIQSTFTRKYNLKNISSRSLEPFYSILDNEKPWTHYLQNKKVLIIHPFVESFQKQLQNNFQMFANTPIFLENQHFVFYKCFQTIAGNHLHENWYETFRIMCSDISKLDFDIALLGCGGYGLPLCHFIKKDLQKSAIYVGGGLQLLFGVMGRRWKNHEIIQKIIRENNSSFVSPMEKETCNNYKTIENGCYW